MHLNCQRENSIFCLFMGKGLHTLSFQTGLCVCRKHAAPLWSTHTWARHWCPHSVSAVKSAPGRGCGFSSVEAAE